MILQSEVYTSGEGEYTEKKSRFLSLLEPVHSEEEALAVIEKRKKTYHDARHTCSAFIISDSSSALISRYSDDGEPSGTAGKPILDVLENNGLVNAVCVVTRYFGGILLGTGGLVRAYTNAAKDALDHAVLIRRLCGYPLDIVTDYNGYGRLEYLLHKEDIPIIDTAFAGDVTISCVIPEEKKDSMNTALTEATGGSAKLSFKDMRPYGLAENKVIWM